MADLIIFHALLMPLLYSNFGDTFLVSRDEFVFLIIFATSGIGINARHRTVPALTIRSSVLLECPTLLTLTCSVAQESGIKDDATAQILHSRPRQRHI